MAELWAKAATDVQAAFTVLGRREVAHERDIGARAVLDLSETDLRRTLLHTADLSWAVFTRADLSWTGLGGATLARAVFTGADLTGANLTHADLTGADLTHTHLIAADLTGANLTETKLRGAWHDQATTTWPEGFDPDASGARAVGH